MFLFVYFLSHTVYIFQHVIVGRRIESYSAAQMSPFIHLTPVNKSVISKLTLKFISLVCYLLTIQWLGILKVCQISHGYKWRVSSQNAQCSPTPPAHRVHSAVLSYRAANLNLPEKVRKPHECLNSDPSHWIAQVDFLQPHSCIVMTPWNSCPNSGALETAQQSKGFPRSALLRHIYCTADWHPRSCDISFMHFHIFFIKTPIRVWLKASGTSFPLEHTLHNFGRICTYFICKFLCLSDGSMHVGHMITLSAMLLSDPSRWKWPR
jgi:hypothetical protein